MQLLVESQGLINLDAVKKSFTVHDWARLAPSPPATMFLLNEFSSSFLDAKWPIVLPTLTAVFVVSRYFKYQNAVRMTGDLPGLAVPFQNMDLTGVLWNWPFGEGLPMHWNFRDSLYKRFNSDVVALRVWLKGIPEIYTNNIDVARDKVGACFDP
ncbi:hypothetical protein DL96DRAFT_1708080 [Flagelloscypha sp. PMI_526]|nr:hypothetical protein DL96DRAFT_1708080 [Flagelloscypha sp. PMI_526]